MPKQSGLKRVRVIALAFGILGVGTTSAPAQLSVDELEVLIRPGVAGNVGTVRVTNDSDKAVQAFIELEDWDRDESGGNRFFPAGTLPQSCGERLTVFPRTLRLEPHRTETLRVSLEGVDPKPCWGIVFVQASEPRVDISGSGITYVIRTGVKVYGEADGARRDGFIEDMRAADVRRPASPQSTDTVTVRAVEIAFRNSGEAHLKTRGSVELRRGDNTLVTRLDIPEFPSVPGSLRRVTVELPAALSAGAYVALALLDYAGQEIAAGQVEFDIK